MAPNNIICQYMPYLFIFCANCLTANVSMNLDVIQYPGPSTTQSTNLPAFTDTLPVGPFFDIEATTNVTSLVNRTAKLLCKVKQLAHQTVSWIREKDSHILSVGRYTFTTDQRFRAIHTSGSEDWTLSLKNPTVGDSGVYECQVSTTPPIKRLVWLNIVVPQTQIVGSPEIHINEGSNINLTCIIEYSANPSQTVSWTHNNKKIGFDSERGGISVVTEKGVTTFTNLLVRKAQRNDSGNYSCVPETGPRARVVVHILTGEAQAAVQHGGHSPNELPLSLILLTATLVYIFVNSNFFT